MLNPSLLDETARTRKRDLIPVTLLILAHAQREGHTGVSTAQLRSFLSKITVLSPDDLDKTAGDTVSRFDRAVLNMVSHHTLTRGGLAKFERDAPSGSEPSAPNYATGQFVITSRGKAHLTDQCLTLLGDTPLTAADLGLQSSGPVREADVLPLALLALAWESHRRSGPIPEADLVTATAGLVPAGSSEGAIQQVVSRLTLYRSVWVRRTPEGLAITDEGKAFLLDTAFIDMFPAPDLSTLTPPADASARRRPRP